MVAIEAAALVAVEIGEASVEVCAEVVVVVADLLATMTTRKTKEGTAGKEIEILERISHRQSVDAKTKCPRSSRAP